MHYCNCVPKRYFEKLYVLSCLKKVRKKRFRSVAAGKLVHFEHARVSQLITVLWCSIIINHDNKAGNSWCHNLQNRGACANEEHGKISSPVHWLAVNWPEFLNLHSSFRFESRFRPSAIFETCFRETASRTSRMEMSTSINFRVRRRRMTGKYRSLIQMHSFWRSGWSKEYFTPLSKSIWARWYLPFTQSSHWQTKTFFSRHTSFEQHTREMKRPQRSTMSHCCQRSPSRTKLPSSFAHSPSSRELWIRCPIRVGSPFSWRCRLYHRFFLCRRCLIFIAISFVVLWSHTCGLRTGVLPRLGWPDQPVGRPPAADY